MSLSCFLPYPTKEIKPDQGEMGKCKEYVEKFEQEVRNLVSGKEHEGSQGRNKKPQ